MGLSLFQSLAIGAGQAAELQILKKKKEKIKYMMALKLG